MTYLLMALTGLTIAFLFNNFSKLKILSLYIFCVVGSLIVVFSLLFNKGLDILVSLQ